MAPLIWRAILAIVLAASAALTLPPLSDAQDRTLEPVPSGAPTCSDRFPAEGPAGVDLRLGCIVSELIGLYTASSREKPPTLSAYALMVGAAVAVGGALIAFTLQRLARRASRRLAPVLASEWWVCPRCHSVNPIAASSCYACGGPPGDGPTMTTDPNPTTPQALGSSSRT